ncbi:uncharacterized protein si:ch211-139g16.8 isoform X1 [Electrophorus electricus]|uniref:uncharacterized protein si:ch211-139g16.8 isoform X1 n=1 Tax=Electrophorus electricus TaxID=8005 RepID=UPI000F0A17EA|nr:uncharacterized protein si:ch211-139g16.8 isoform X1 [Electrophorus electricus]
MVLCPFLPIICTLVIAQVLTTEECQVAVIQSEELLFGSVNQSLSIPCHVTVSACNGLINSSPMMVWYMFKKDSHSQLDLKSQPLKYRLETQHLSIHSLSADDNGVYYCAAILKTVSANKEKQAFGSGTTVTVKENSFTTGHMLLVMLLVLLMLYSLTILSFIVCIKTRGSTLFLQGRLRTSQIKSTSTRRVQFGAVVQELYTKRNLRSSNKTSPSEASPENKCETHRKKEERVTEDTTFK